MLENDLNKTSFSTFLKSSALTGVKHTHASHMYAHTLKFHHTFNSQVCITHTSTLFGFDFGLDLWIWNWTSLTGLQDTHICSLFCILCCQTPVVLSPLISKSQCNLVTIMYTNSISSLIKLFSGHLVAQLVFLLLWLSPSLRLLSRVSFLLVQTNLCAGDLCSLDVAEN